MQSKVQKTGHKIATTNEVKARKKLFQSDDIRSSGMLLTQKFFKIKFVALSTNLNI